MAKETTSKKGIEIVHLSLSISGQILDFSDGEPQNIQLNESASLNFNDEPSMHQELNRKPYLEDLIPMLVKALLQNYDPKKQNVKKLKDVLSSL
jgi:hypothetical protein